MFGMKHCFFILLFLSLISCKNGTGKQNTDSTMPADSSGQNSGQPPYPDTVLTEKINSVQNEIGRIQAINKWDSIPQVDLFLSTEGGEANYYYKNGALIKIEAKNYGETYQSLEEYYLQANRLVYVFEKISFYNRPIYYDSTAMREAGDTAVFDPAKTVINESRYYFENGQLFLQKTPQGDSSFLPNIHPYEELRLQTQLEELVAARIDSTGRD